MSAFALVSAPEEREREVLEFDHGVRAYEPPSGGYWRIRWEEAGRRRESTAGSRAAAITKADELVERLSQGTDTAMARALDDAGQVLTSYDLPTRAKTLLPAAGDLLGPTGVGVQEGDIP